jgi:CubicO group peptidase (beta-lactamase class C family)
MSEENEFGSEGITRRSFLYGATAVGVSLPILKSASAFAQEGAEREVKPPEEFKAIRDFIEEKIRTGIVPSLVIMVVRNNQTIWAEAFGYADLEKKRTATLNGIYKIASVSKPITVTGLMTLVDRGLVDLDKPANEYLPDAKLRAHVGSANGMTLRRLANHTSGLPIHENLFYDGVQPLSPNEVIRRYGFAAWEPGTHFQYCNLGTAILGFITEAESKMPWARYLKRRIFDPLGMKRTFAELPPGHEGEAAGVHHSDLSIQYDYDLAGRFVRTGPHATDHAGGSSMWSSAGDLIRFAQMHLNGGRLGGVRILNEASVSAMQQFTVDDNNEPGRKYGVGWWSDTSLGQRNFCQSGGGPGMGVMLSAYPEVNTVTVVLTNYFGAMAPEVTKRLARVLLPNSQASGTRAAEPIAPSAQSAPSMSLAGTWQGRMIYPEGDIPLRLVIHENGIAEIAFGKRPLVKLNEVTLGKSGFTGSTEGVLIRRPDFQGVSVLEFQLRRDGNRLIGISDTYAKGYFELAHWVEVEKRS